MIAGLLNTLVGLGLTYLAIFPQAGGSGGNHLILVGAVLTVVLALWARRSDVSPWQSNVAIAAGAILAITTIADQFTRLSDVLMFWTVCGQGLSQPPCRFGQHFIARCHLRRHPNDAG